VSTALPVAAEALEGLAGDIGDDVKVLVQVQHCQPGQLGGGRDDQVRDRRSTMLAMVGLKVIADFGDFWRRGA
jgi:hypothetical protein